MTAIPSPSRKELRRLERLKTLHGDFDHMTCWGYGENEGLGRCPQVVFDEGDELARGWLMDSATQNPASLQGAIAIGVNNAKIANRIVTESACLPGMSLPWTTRSITHTDSEGNRDHPAHLFATACSERNRSRVTNPAIAAVMNASVKGADPVARSLRRKVSPLLTTVKVDPRLPSKPVTPPPVATEVDPPKSNWWLAIPAALILFAALR